MAKLTFHPSTMNAGKTMEIIRAAFDFEKDNMSVLVFTSGIDTRSKKNKIESRMGPERDAISIQAKNNLYKKIKKMDSKPDCIFVDEVQFFTPKQIWELYHIAHELNIGVECYGLRVDFMGNPFPGSAQLMAIADDIREIHTTCWCKRKATMNGRVIDGKMVRHGQQVMVGGNESYKKLCGFHWLSGQYKKD